MGDSLRVTFYWNRQWQMSRALLLLPLRMTMQDEVFPTRVSLVSPPFARST